MRNPCIGCEFQFKDKNRPECTNCNKRLEYVGGIGAMTHSVPLARTNLAGGGHGHGGVTMKKQRIPRMTDEQRAYVESLCQARSLNIDDVLDYTKKTSAIAQARAEIAVETQGVFSLTKRGAAEAFGVSEASFYNWVVRAKKAEKESRPRPGVDTTKATPSKAGAVGEKSRQDAAPTEAAVAAALGTIFEGREDLLKRLRDYAEDEMRTVRDQVVYLVRAAVLPCLVVALVAASIPAPAHAGGSMRCGTVLIDVGDRAERVLRYCGDPDERITWMPGDAGRAKTPLSYEGSAMIRANIRIEEWVYDRGGTRFSQRIMMENGRVSSIHDGPRWSE